MYNGHRNYNAWNIALWLGNDETLYWNCRRALRMAPNRRLATEMVMAALPERTPDGVKYTRTNVRLALRGL